MIISKKLCNKAYTYIELLGVLQRYWAYQKVKMTLLLLDLSFNDAVASP